MIELFSFIGPYWFSSVEKSYQYQYSWGLGPSLRSGTNISTGTTVPVVVVAVGPPSAAGSRGRLGCRQQVLRQVAHDWGRALVLGSPRETGERIFVAPSQQPVLRQVARDWGTALFSSYRSDDVGLCFFIVL